MLGVALLSQRRSPRGQTEAKDCQRDEVHDGEGLRV
jgi:hypothetical protein